jgi:hypothetical protein
MPKAATVEITSDWHCDTLGKPSTASSIAVASKEQIDPRDVIRLTHSMGFNHLVQKNGPEYDRELAVAEAMLNQRSSFFENPLQLILGAEIKDMSRSFYAKALMSDKKANVLSPFEEFILNLKGTKSIRDEVRTVADELFTNGSKNAWIESGKRTVVEEMKPGTIEFFAAADESRLVFGCRDSYGKLDVSRVLSRIWSCFENGVAQSINNGTGGAGIGSYMVFTTCIGYYAGVDPGIRTVVCVSFPLGLSARELSNLPKNIHLIR